MNNTPNLHTAAQSAVDLLNQIAAGTARDGMTPLPLPTLNELARDAMMPLRVALAAPDPIRTTPYTPTGIRCTLAAFFSDERRGCDRRHADEYLARLCDEANRPAAPDANHLRETIRLAIADLRTTADSDTLDAHRVCGDLADTLTEALMLASATTLTPEQQAAPDLLASLRELTEEATQWSGVSAFEGQSESEDNEKILNRARAAIAKAQPRA